MDGRQQITRRVVLAGAGVLAVAGVARTGAPTVPDGSIARTTLGVRRASTLARLQGIAREHPVPTLDTGAVRTPPGSRDVAELERRFADLAEDRRARVRRGADWWGTTLDLTRPTRTHTALATIDLNELDVRTLENVLEACSLALTGVVPGLRGANNSVAALWVSGVSKNATASWART